MKLREKPWEEAVDVVGFLEIGYSRDETVLMAGFNEEVLSNGTAVDPANYSYVAGVLTFPVGTAYSLTVPAASGDQGSARTPGRVSITVTGTVN